LADSRGTPVTRLNGYEAGGSWISFINPLVIPHGGSVRFPVTSGNYGIFRINDPWKAHEKFPVPEHGLAIWSAGDPWKLSGDYYGSYTVSAIFTGSERPKDFRWPSATSSYWKGSLDLPGVMLPRATDAAYTSHPADSKLVNPSLKIGNGQNQP
jgi:hypothetical protein